MMDNDSGEEASPFWTADKILHDLSCGNFLDPVQQNWACYATSPYEIERHETPCGIPQS
jgi:hypothetical protein